ncbi:MAG: hypothetical protein AAF456_13405 [Planctomycetota bacterium]
MGYPEAQPDSGYPSPQQPGSPDPGYYYPPPPDPRSRLTPPAIGLLVHGIMTAFSSVMTIVYGVAIMLTLGSIQGVVEDDIVQQSGGEEGLSEQELEQIREVTGLFAMFGQGYGVFLMLLGVLGIICAVLVIVGGFKMMNARSYTWCIVAAVAALVPLPGCWPLGIGVSIWALVILSDQYVKSVFH